MTEETSRKREVQISRELKGCHDAVDKLSERVSDLETRLNQTMRDEPEPEKDASLKEAESLVPMAEDIRSIHTGITKQNHRIGSMLGRLEL